METLTLATPLTSPSVVVSRLILDWDGAAIYVVLRAPGGRRLEYSYGGAKATTMMKNLNKANFTLKSLHKWIMEQLQADFTELAGITSGAPD